MAPNALNMTGLHPRTPFAPSLTVTDLPLPTIDIAQMKASRLARLRDQLRRRDFGGAVLFDPVNIRYAIGYRDAEAFAMHIWGGYVFLAVDGPVVLFGGSRVQGDLHVVTEVRPMLELSYFLGGSRRNEHLTAWADEVAELARRCCGTRPRLAMDRPDLALVQALGERGVTVADGWEAIEHARCIKSQEEVQCMSASLAAAEVGMARMREALQPGITENQLWSILHQVNIALGGEWIEDRMLSSGERTNPWRQLASDRIIRPGELVAFDTDMVGPFGYCADVSRTFFCGPGRPSPAQRDLYRLAHEEVQHNIALLRPGLTFKEFSDRAFQQPDRFVAHRYQLASHGIGLCDEYPSIYYRQDWPRMGYDGIIEENMTLCIESFMGAEDGGEGVKLEEQVLVTAHGPVVLSKFPFEEELLA